MASATQVYHLPEDAVWFITGCSSGIGQALAQHVAKTKNRVVATARNPATLADIADGDNVLKLQLDVTSIPSIESALASTLEKWGRIDVVVNNAGYTLTGEAEGAGDAEARTLMDTNFWGVVDVTKRALGIMRDENPKTGQQGGVIFNVSSVGGWAGFPGQSFYHASKFAMEGWTEAVAKEVSSWNISLCCLEPGGVKTNYATTSMKSIEVRHPAYADPSLPSNALLSFIADEKNHHNWTEPAHLAAAVYSVANGGKRIPIRVPLGSDAFGLMSADIETVKKDLEEFKHVSLSVGDATQMEAASFLL